MSQFEENAQLSEMTIREFCSSRNVAQRNYLYYHGALAVEMNKEFTGNGDQPVFLISGGEDLNLKESRYQENAEISSENRSIDIRIGSEVSDEFLLRLMRDLNNVKKRNTVCFL